MAGLPGGEAHEGARQWKVWCRTNSDDDDGLTKVEGRWRLDTLAAVGIARCTKFFKMVTLWSKFIEFIL